MNKLTHFVFCILAFCVNVFCFAQNYQAPYFTDSAQRLERIKATQTVVDRLYKEHAAKNNFPGFVYGLVAEGKLIYTGATGYAQVKKKIP
ncbi:MAG: serine hydrolase, partial [Bacteroidota bacterium]